MLELGTKAPAFSLPDQNGQLHTLEEYKGKAFGKVKAEENPAQMLEEL